MKHQAYHEVWGGTFGKEGRHLSQGIPGVMEGTDTLKIFPKKEVPAVTVSPDLDMNNTEDANNSETPEDCELEVFSNVDDTEEPKSDKVDKKWWPRPSASKKLFNDGQTPFEDKVTPPPPVHV